MILDARAREPEIPDLAGGGFLRRSADLLESTARLLGVQLEIWADRPAPMLSRGAIGRCHECAARDPGQAQTCQAIRTARCRGSMSKARAIAWTCPNGLELSAFPILGPDSSTGALLAIGSNGEGGKAPPPGFPLVQRRGCPHGRRRRAFLRDLARLLSDHMLLYREMSSLTGELSTRYSELQMLYSIAGRLTRHEDLRLALRRMLEETREAVHADAALLSLRDGRIREVMLRPGLAADAALDRRACGRLARTLQKRIQEGGRRYFLGSPESTPLLGRPVQALAVSVIRNGSPYGVLSLLQFDAARNFRSSDIMLLESLSEQVALAAGQTEHFEDLRDFLMATVKSLVGAIEAKDSYTSGHSERVNLISMLVGKQLRLEPPEMETLRWASILHDVGKIGMPEELLRKPGRLTSEEYEIIKEHPERGYGLLAPIRQLAEAARHVRAHHEKVDGSGYPEGLAGDAIPRLARIIAVADTWDALTSTRSYRSARTFDYAIAEVRRVQGTQLDRDVVDAFLELVPFLREHRVMIYAPADTYSETSCDTGNAAERGGEGRVTVERGGDRRIAAEHTCETGLALERASEEGACRTYGEAAAGDEDSEEVDAAA